MYILIPIILLTQLIITRWRCGWRHNVFIDPVVGVASVSFVARQQGLQSVSESNQVSCDVAHPPGFLGGLIIVDDAIGSWSAGKRPAGGLFTYACRLLNKPVATPVLGMMHALHYTNLCLSQNL